MRRFAFVSLLVVAPLALPAQAHEHTPGMSHQAPAVPKENGQAAFAAIAGNPADARAVARIRGLGFIGVVALGDHHAPHHLGIANGTMTAMHGHH